ncbi:MAG: ribonuclease Z, partial [Thermoproteota archaeon]
VVGPDRHGRGNAFGHSVDAVCKYLHRAPEYRATSAETEPRCHQDNDQARREPPDLWCVAMSARELVVLGTASQLPTRHRAHNSYALRWDDQLILFDPGEGTQRQCTLAGVAIARATAVCITHFHGDHCLGLPGVIQRRSFDNRTTAAEIKPLPIFFPGDGIEYFERMRNISISHDVSAVVPEPIDAPGIVGTLGSFTLSAVALEHRCTTYGYRLDEPDGVSVVPERLAQTGVSGPDVGVLLAQGWIDTPQGRITADDVTIPRKGQSMAFVMDTVMCDGALELAEGADLLVCESTYLHEHLDLATEYRHMTARQAGQLAAAAGARRLLLTHFSARYSDASVMGDEASRYHDDVVVAQDLVPVAVPKR